jgi:hypothetical protein
MSRSHTLRAAVLGVAITLASEPVFAQSFNVGDKEVQVHGSIQQGFIVGTGNNFLTMKTNDGSVEMTDGAFNLSTQVTRKLRVGGQLYSRNIGDLGQGQLQLDWGFADYKFHDAFGVRGGKVKTPMGLFNDTQDMEFLHTWALLPQGSYPLDLRSVVIAHKGADAYGTVSMKKAGKVQYNVYGGFISDDKNGGYRYGIEDRGLSFTGDIKQRGGGLDARWLAPVDGLVTGYSFLRTRIAADFGMTAPFKLQLSAVVPKWDHHVVYGDYQKDRLHLSAEWRREIMETRAVVDLSAIDPAVLTALIATMAPGATPDMAASMPPVSRSGSWFTAASYRLSDRLEVGSYHSRYLIDAGNLQANMLADDHVYDTAVTGRVDLNRFWNVKVEGHFMDGYGDTVMAHGFYLRVNQQGFDSTTKLLVVRTGVSF